MKPLIKWSGGKSQEIKFFEYKIPKNIKRYIEPFIGGGGVFFNLEYDKSIINDVNFELISLYSLIVSKNDRKEFITHLETINKQRTLFNNYFEDFSDNNIINVFNSTFNKEIDICFNEEVPFIIKDKELNNLLQKSIKDKINRVKRIEIKNDKVFTPNELKAHFTTSFQSALYFYCRKIYNNGFDDKIELTKYIANWYYVREFCYSSMFRFSKTGNFNVPYGGIGYNSKDFSTKINRIKTDKKLYTLLNNSDINLLDFEDLFKKYNYFKKDDFIFLDPPYDSEFSQYNKDKDFDKNEQIRLRDCLLKTKAKFMIVIKETNFISEIYSSNFFKIDKFDKKYMTNMRNRNDKDVVHLIITNY